SRTLRIVAGALVERSTRMASRGASASQASETASMTAGPGSDVNVISLRAATAAGESARSAPAATRASTRARSVSCTTTAWPSARRFAAIAPPMLPAPMTPSRRPLSRPMATRLPGRHAERTVEPDGLAVQHRVLDDVADESGELRRAAETGWERNLRRERLALRFRQCREHGCVEGPGRDRDAPYAETGEVARDRQRQGDDSSLRRRVGR